MSDRGGLFGKLGVRYEDRWTVRCVLGLLRDEAEAIRLEPPGPAGDGVEFWLRFPDRTEFHQVKRQRSRDGRWSISALSGVLVAFLDKLRDPEAYCVFVSGHAAFALEGLVLRARAAQSRTEFDTELSTNRTWRAHYDELQSAWGAPDADIAFDALRRIEVVTISESELARSNRLETGVVIAGDLTNAVAVVTELVRDHASDYLDAREVWRLLALQKYTPNPWRSSRALAELVGAANERFISSRERTLIGQKLITRPEAARLRSLIAEHPFVVLDGAAGMGKSDVLLEFVRELDADEVPFLGFRLDRATPTSLPETLGKELGLPGSPPNALAALAHQRPAVLVIDQLDIVSTTSGRNPEFFDCVLEMIELARTRSNLRVVISCRTFDIENDTRLRNLIPAADPRPIVTVGPLDHEQITQAVRLMGLDAGRLNATQLAILGVPLHLSLLSEIAAPADDELTQPFDFATADELYELFWNSKQRELQHRLGRVPAWTAVLDRLVDDMSEQQLLHAPREIVDEWQLDVEAMLSSRVLTRDGVHLSFFHETFFDYVFARRFSARRRTIAELLSSDQFLFRRAQVRQILAYSRGRAATYGDDLAFLAEHESVRFHLRDLVVAWLAQVDPTDEEWALLLPHLEDPESPIHGRAWQTLGTSEWLRTADRHGFLTRCLDSNVHVNEVVTAIGNAGAPFGDRTVELVRPHLADPEWADRIVWLLRRSDLAENPPLAGLFVHLLESGALDRLGVTGEDFWHIASGLPKTGPALANRLLGSYLEDRLSVAQQAGFAHPFVHGAGVIPANLYLHEFVIEAADAAPTAYLEHVWPRVHDLIQAGLAPVRDGRLRQDDIWSLKHFSETYGDLDDHLLIGAEHAFRALAKDSPNEFSHLHVAHANTDSETVVFLLFEGYSANPEVFADTALDSLTTDPRRLRVAYSNGDEWQTRRLLEAATLSASDAAIDRLEPTILSYFTPWEKSAAGHKEFGLSQFTLLGGVEPDRRTPGMRKRLAEWQRKFLFDDVAPPTGIISGIVQSPIADDAALRMSDAQWLSAMRRYADDDFRSRRQLLLGGADQLASVLEARAKAEPDRFSALASRMPDTTNVAYFDAILRGVVDSDTGPNLENTVALLLRCHALPGRPTGRWIARPLRHHLDKRWPPAIIGLLTWYATQDPDPDADPTGDDDRHGALAQRGLNSVRGGIAYELARFVGHNTELVDPLLPSLTSLASDRIMAVRAMAADIVLCLLGHDSAGALNLFDLLMTGATDDLLAVRNVSEVVRYRLEPDFARLRSIVERMISASNDETQTNGAVLATLAALSNETAHRLAALCAAGTEAQRVGVARVAAANLTTARFREYCEHLLIRFFDDPSKAVRDAAATVIRKFDGDEIEGYSSLIASFNDSVAGAENSDELLFAFSEMTRLHPGTALEACATVLARIAADDHETRLRGLRQADQIMQIVVRVYADGDRGVKNRSLDLIDRSLELNIYGATRALAEHDRPWLAVNS